MGPDLEKLSDEELFRRLDLVQSRLAWMGTYSHSQSLINQILAMQYEINDVLMDRAEKARMAQKLASEPMSIETDVERVKKTENSNSRAKSKSDMITRLRRTSTPSTLKDATDG